MPPLLPTRAHRSGALLPVLALLALPLLPACGGGGDAGPTGPGFYRRLAFEPVQGAPTADPTEIRATALLTPSPDWTVEDAEARAGTHRVDGENVPILRLESRGARRVVIPGPFDPGSFDQVVVNAIQSDKEDFRLRLRRDGENVIETPYMRLVGAATPRAVTLLVGQNRRETEPFDDLVLEMRGVRPDTGLLSVGLVHKPLALWLPPAAGGPRPVTIAEETRHAVGLPSDAPLSVTLRPEPGAELRVGVGVPESIRRPGEDLRLRIALTALAGGAPLREVEIALEPTLERRSRWHDVTIPCGDLAEAVRATFTLSSGLDEAVCALATPVLARPGAAPPTVVLVTSDTHRGDHLGLAERGVEVATPTLDALAQRGVFFEDCYSPTNITNPSHVSILTGLSPRDTGIVDNVSPLAERATTLAEVFAEAGWHTIAGTSAIHLKHDSSGLAQGFDRSAVTRSIQRDSSKTLAAIDGWLDEAEGLPLFVWLHVFDAHGPYEPPEEYSRLYYPEDRDPYDPALPAPAEEMLPHWDDEVRDLDWPLAQYKSEVTYFDERLGEFLARPRFADAVVAVTADHGESLLAHEVYFSHMELYPDTLHVPLVLAWPGAPAGTRVTHPVTSIDLGRTLLDLAGLRGDFPGRNLMDRAADAAQASRPRFFVSSHQMSAAVTRDQHLLVVHLRDHRLTDSGRLIPRHAVELYDLGADPECLTNLAEERLDLARTLRAPLVQWLAQAPAETLAGSLNADETLLEGLAALGYTTDVTPSGGGALMDPKCGCAQCARFR